MVVRQGFLLSRMAAQEAEAASETHPPAPSEPDRLLLRQDALSQSP